jgi:DNA-binding LacI/PurR family transcriptional regulator
MSSRGRGDRVTLQTIADRAGVSTATVSNAYNRPDRLSAKLRERILQVARELNHAGPDPLARQLRLGRTGAMGVLFTEPLPYAFSDPAAVLFLAALAEHLQADSSSLVLLPSPPGADAARTIRQAVVDGICIYSMPEHDPAVGAVLERKVPAVFVDEPRQVGQAFVGIDDHAGGLLVGRHLVGLGHRRFGVLTPRLLADDHVGGVRPERLHEATFSIFGARIAGLRQAPHGNSAWRCRTTSASPGSTTSPGRSGPSLR